MADTSVPTTGSLDSVALGDLLQAFADDGCTGLVRFDGDDQLLVCLADGEVYLATSASGPSIHQIVVGSGATPEAAWADAAGAPGGLAAALAGDDRVDADRLRAVLYELTVATVVELLVPGTESYELLVGQTHQVGPHFRFPVSEVVADASRRLTAWRTIGATLPSTSTRVRRSPALPSGSTTDSLTAVEWQVVAAMPAEGTVADVIDASGLSAFTVFDVLHRLVLRGLVQPLEGPASTA